MEIPTTSNVELLKEFQSIFDDEIRVLANDEYECMPTKYRDKFKSHGQTLVPSSIMIDIMLWITYFVSRNSHASLSDTIKDDLEELMSQGEMSKVIEKIEGQFSAEIIDTSSQFYPFWLASKAMWLAVQAYAQHPSKGAEYIE
jgi:hypothetical protein